MFKATYDPSSKSITVCYKGKPGKTIPLSSPLPQHTQKNLSHKSSQNFPKISQSWCLSVSGMSGTRVQE